MMFFFDSVQTFSTTGKSAKGKALQEMAKSLERVLVLDKEAPVKIVTAMRELAADIDKRYRRGRETFVDYTFDEASQSGQISAVPCSDNPSPNEQPYFRIYYYRVAHSVDFKEAVLLMKGGAL